jgi:chorismate mutase
MMTKAKTPPSLAELREEIDAIDASMHTLLMQRGEIIDRLISVKRTQEVGSAFRPAREAEMMRRLVDRHHGILPLDTVESIWRVIISSFTYVQAPFSVHADLTASDALMRDTARFHFGFTVPFVPHIGASSVIAALSESRGDLGLIPATSNVGAWWRALEFDSAPKIIARLPFIQRADHPAALPVFVVSRVAADAFVKDVEMWSVRIDAWNEATAAAIGGLAEVLVAPDAELEGVDLLLSLRTGTSFDAVSAALVSAGATIGSSALVGSHAAGYKVPR